MAKTANGLVCEREDHSDPWEAVRLASSTGTLTPHTDQVNRNEEKKICRGVGDITFSACVCVLALKRTPVRLLSYFSSLTEQENFCSR